MAVMFDSCCVTMLLFVYIKSRFFVKKKEVVSTLMKWLLWLLCCPSVLIGVVRAGRPTLFGCYTKGPDAVVMLNNNLDAQPFF